MEVNVLNEAGYNEALYGLSLSYNRNIGSMPRVAERLAKYDNGENKFLESIVIWLDVRAPRYWWQQFDTYRVGITKQSESTMHTLMKRHLSDADFSGTMKLDHISWLNSLIDKRDFQRLKENLPEGFMQRRVVCMNYKALRHIYSQRYDHRLHEWREFLDGVLEHIEHPEFIREGE